MPRIGEDVKILHGSYDIMRGKYSNFDEDMEKFDGAEGVIHYIMNEDSDATTWYEVLFDNDERWWYALECLDIAQDFSDEAIADDCACP